MKAQIQEKFFPFTLELKVETQKEAEILFYLSQHKDVIPHLVSKDIPNITAGDVTFLLDTISDVVIRKLDAEKILMQEFNKDILKQAKN